MVSGGVYPKGDNPERSELNANRPLWPSAALWFTRWASVVTTGEWG